MRRRVSKGVKQVRVFAPASIGNIGPGFDVLGMALAGLGDTLVASRTSHPGVMIREISGDEGKLPRRAEENTAGIAARALLDHLGIREGVALSLHKGIPGTGLGSSAASAVAGAFAVNALFGRPLKKEALIPFAAKAERSVSGGIFLDNVGPSMMGGITWNHPVNQQVVRLGALPKASIVVATPDFPLLTRESRKVLPKEVPMEIFISNMAQASLMAWAAGKGDVALFGRSILDRLAEPARAPLIRGFDDVKAAALQAGALGCSIAGAGASIFAVCAAPAVARRVARAMAEAFGGHRVRARMTVTRIDPFGARLAKGR